MIKGEDMKAYEVIKKYGWIQRAYGNVEMGFCLVGAIAESNQKGAVEAVEKELYASSYILTSLTAWNDTIGRTKEEVIALLRKANV